MALGSEPSPSHRRDVTSRDISLPLEAQHLVLAYLQTLLEAACYAYGKREMPSLLQSRGWDCAAAVELNRWMEELKRKSARFADNESHEVPPDSLFRSVANIRHAAVHRQHVSPDILERFLIDAETLTTILDAPTHLNKVRSLRQRTLRAMTDLHRSTRAIREEFEAALRDIEAQRETLKRSEEAKRANMEQECRTYQFDITRDLKSLISTYDEDDVITTDNSSVSTCPSPEGGSRFI